MIRFFVSIVFLYLICLVNPTESMAEEKSRIIVQYEDEDNSESPHIEVKQINKRDVKEEFKRLKQSKSVKHVELDLKMVVMDVPNDPFVFQQDKDWMRMNVYQSFHIYKPVQTVTVAVIDSGIDLDHPDLQQNLVKGVNIINSASRPQDVDGHGTHVAGLIGAVSNNNIGIASPVQNVKLMPVKVIEGREGYLSNVVNGIKYAVDHGAQIINLSMGSYSNSNILKDAIDYATKNDVLVIAASGNDDESTVVYPAAYSEVIAVSSFNSANGKKAVFSNYGSGINLGAPGVDIYSTIINGYGSKSGTSMSTAYVSSLASMVWNQEPALSSKQVKKVLESGATETKIPYYFGSGLVNANHSLQEIINYNRLHGSTSVETSIKISQKGWHSLPDNELTVKGQLFKGKMVIIADGDKFPDSLAAAPLAGQLKIPIFLEKNNRISPGVIEEISRLKATHVIIAGGYQAVPLSVEEHIEKAGLKVNRVFGRDRDETALELSKLIKTTKEHAFVVSGENYPDSISVAAIAGQLNQPVFYVKKNSIDPLVKIAIDQYKSVTVVGGEQVISNLVFKSLPSSRRIAGVNRYETNKKVIEHYSKNTSQIFIASGENYPDALTSSPLAAMGKSPVLLVNPQMLYKDTIELIQETQINQYTVIGGPKAIIPAAAWEIDRLIFSK